MPNVRDKKQMIIAMIKAKGECKDITPKFNGNNLCSVCALDKAKLCNANPIVTLNRCMDAAEKVFTKTELFDLLL